MGDIKLETEARELQDQLEQATTVTDLPSPNNEDKSHVDKILNQRYSQREHLLQFYIIFTAISFGVVVLVLSFQGIFKITKEIEIFSIEEFQIVVGGLFVQILGVLYIITKALWNDKDYLPYMQKNGR
jgi:hypothetical protein